MSAGSHHDRHDRRQAQASQARRQAALLRLSTGIAAAHDEADVCRTIVEGLHDEALGYDFLGAFLTDESTGDRVLHASIGWPDVPENFRVPPGRGDRAIARCGPRTRGREGRPRSSRGCRDRR